MSAALGRAPRSVREEGFGRANTFVSPASLGGAARALAHEAVPAGVMAAAVLGGHTAGAMVAAAGALVLLSFGYAPLARTKHWAREHLADLWAMLLVMATMAFMATGTLPGSAGTAAHAHRMGGSPGSLALSAAAPGAMLVVVVGWIAVRALLARRGWHIHSAVSAGACGAGLAWMLML